MWSLSYVWKYTYFYFTIFIEKLFLLQIYINAFLFYARIIFIIPFFFQLLQKSVLQLIYFNICFKSFFKLPFE